MLSVQPCQARCDWARTDDDIAGEAVFRCAGCGSEWMRSEAWTPCQQDGTIPAAVAGERSRPV